MARYTGPVCRLCRRERMKLYLKGAKCDTMKCPIERRPYPPGDHGRSRRTNTSEYLVQLREKQKARRIYGLMEKQFRKVYAEANRQQGVTGENLLRLLECRLDNVVFRAGWAASRAQARQLVRHGHVKVNGKRVTIPSYRGPQGQRRLVGRQGPLDDRHPPQRRHARSSHPALARDGRRRQRSHRARPADARAHRRARARAAHRRALLQVTLSSRRLHSPPHIKQGTPMLVIQRPTVETLGEADGNRQRFAVSPLEPGFGYTIGNSLRRTLLSSIPGAAITTVRFDDALHEFGTVNGVTEDVTDIILNLKDIVLQSTSDDPVVVRLDMRGPAKVTAGDIKLPVRGRDPQPRAAHRDAEPARPTRRRPHCRAGPRLPLGRAPGWHLDDRHHPDRRDLLAGAPGHLQRRADSRRAVDELRPPGARHRDRRLHHAPRRACVRWRHAALAGRARRRHEREPQLGSSWVRSSARAPARLTSIIRSKTSTCPSARATA